MQKDSHSDFTEKSKALEAKVQRIQHHQTSFTINAKGTSLSRKHKRRERSTKNKSKTIKKMVIGPYILIITVEPYSKVTGVELCTKVTG